MAINISHAADSLTPTTGSLTIAGTNAYLNGTTIIAANTGSSGNVLTSNGTSWISSAPPAGAGTITTTDFTATAGQTTFSANYTVGLVNVYRNGVKLGKADFTATSGTSIVLAVGANVGDLVQIEAFSSLNIYSTVTSDTFSGNGSTTTFTMSVTPFNASSVLVVISGVTQAPSTYSVSGTTLTFTTAPPAGSSNISVRYLALPATGAVTGINFGSTGLTPSSVTSGNVTVSGTLAVANGGTGTSTPATVAGTGISVSGSFPNQTVTNSGVTSLASGTGISVSGSTGGVTVTNSGVTSVTGGTGISVSASTGSVTISSSGSSGVTSVATGNGLSGGTITSTGTLVIAAPSAASVGAYTIAGSNGGGPYTAGSTIAGSSLYYVGLRSAGTTLGGNNGTAAWFFSPSGTLPGTWRCMAYQGSYCGCGPNASFGLWCRVS